ncbi:MAG: hypothetical protein KKB31_02245 [Nanoarchaeota archaeon]|nr:hypothetical protein [Nanoarchaeota archaeon]
MDKYTMKLLVITLFVTLFISGCMIIPDFGVFIDGMGLTVLFCGLFFIMTTFFEDRYK